MTTTACADVVAGLKSVLDTFIAANPTLLHAAYPSRPSGVTEVPFAYIGARDEVIKHSEGVRDRTFTPTVVVIDTYADNDQTMGRLDILQDGLVDAFTTGVYAIRLNGGASYGVLQQTGVRDGDISFENLLAGTVTWYRARTFVFDEILIAEGRN